MKLKYFLNEKKNMGEIYNKIKSFFRENPNPSDKHVHEYAESIGIDEHKFEEHIYMILSDYVKKDKVLEQKELNEIFIENAINDLEILRLSMIAELDAVNLYERMATTAKNQDIKKTLLSVAQEEKVHAEEFETLLEEIDPEYEEAGGEAQKEIEDLKGK